MEAIDLHTLTKRGSFNDLSSESWNILMQQMAAAASIKTSLFYICSPNYTLSRTQVVVFVPVLVRSVMGQYHRLASADPRRLGIVALALIYLIPYLHKFWRSNCQAQKISHDKKPDDHNKICAETEPDIGLTQI